MNFSLIVPVAVLGFGCLVAFVVVGRREPSVGNSVAASLAWGPGLAAGVLSLGSFLAVAAGLDRPDLGHFLGIALVVGVVSLLRVNRRPLPAARPKTRGEPRLRWAVSVGWMVSAVLVVGYVWSFVRWLIHRPLGSYDATAIWTYRAIQWFRSGDAFPETIGLLLESKPGYPLLLPGLIVSQFSMWGDESTTIAVATGWFFVIGLAAVSFIAVARRAGTEYALAAPALLLSTPMVWHNAFAQCADLPLAYFTLTAAVGLADLARGDRRLAPPWITGFFLGMMVWTKNEGMVLSLILVAVFAGEAWRCQRRIHWRNWSAVAFGALPGVLATVFFKHAWVATGEVGRFLGPGLFSRLVDPQRWLDVAAAFADRLTPGSGGAIWGGTWLVLAGLLVVHLIRRPSREAGRMASLYGIVFGLFFVFDVVAYVITPDPLSWHLRTSLDRLLMQILPFAVVAVFSAFGGASSAAVE